MTSVLADHQRKPLPSPRFWANRSVLLLAVPLAASCLVYGSILENYFFHDDFLHLYNLANNGLIQFLFTPHGGHVLVLRNLIFYTCYRLFGLAPLGYFVLVLLTHLANVWLLFLVVRDLTGNPFLASVGAALWGVLPANEASLGWYSVYGNVLVTTVGLGLLYDLVRLAETRRPVSGLRLATWCLLLLAGMTCFGIGIALAMTFSAVVYLLLPDSPDRTKATATLLGLTICVPIVYVGLFRLYAAISGNSSSNAAVFLGQIRNWRLNAEMFGELLAYGTSSLVVPQPCTPDGGWLLCYALSSVSAVAVVVLFACASARVRRTLLALTLLLGATYASIAIGRTWFTVWIRLAVAWSATQPRYHYVGPALITIIVCVVLNEIGRFIFTARLRQLAPGAVLCVALVTQLALHQPIDHHEEARAATQSVLDRFEFIAGYTPKGGDICIRNHGFRWVGGLVGDPASFPGWAAVFAITHPANTIHGRTVHFIETNPRVLLAAQAKPDRRAAGLLVAPDRIPARCRIF